MSEIARGKQLVDEAYAARAGGDTAGSLLLYRQALIAFGAEPIGRAHCLRHIGDLARELGQLDEARAALQEAEHLYRERVVDTLSLGNTVRILAMIDDDRGRWIEAREIYARAAVEIGLDLKAAFDECDRRIATLD